MRRSGMARLPWQIVVALILYTIVAAELGRQALRNRRRGPRSERRRIGFGLGTEESVRCLYAPELRATVGNGEPPLPWGRIWGVPGIARIRWFVERSREPAEGVTVTSATAASRR